MLNPLRFLRVKEKGKVGKGAVDTGDTGAGRKS